MKRSFGVLVLLLISLSAYAGQADVVDVRVENEGDGYYSFFVSVRHDDQGWDHYADKWEIVAPDGKVLGTRVLAHPHVNEQPFTRHLSRVRISSDIKQVIVRAHDSMHGSGGAAKRVVLPQ